MNNLPAHAGDCGGCTLQHMSVSFQQAWKRRRLLEGMENAGLGEVSIGAVRHMVNSVGYRSKAQFMLKREASGEWRVGLYAPRSHELVSLQSCLVQDELTESVLIQLPQALSDNRMFRD